MGCRRNCTVGCGWRRAATLANEHFRRREGNWVPGGCWDLPQSTILDQSVTVLVGSSEDQGPWHLAITWIEERCARLYQAMVLAIINRKENFLILVALCQLNKKLCPTIVLWEC